MLGPKILEITYANGVEYKRGVESETIHGQSDIRSTRNSDGCQSTYHTSSSPFLDQIYPFFSIKKYQNGDKKLKYYFPSNETCRLIIGEDTVRGKDLSKYDLCPDIDRWVGIGQYQHTETSYDLIFTVSRDGQLNSISEYYGLRYPLPEGESIEVDRDQWINYDMRYSSRDYIEHSAKEFLEEGSIFGSIKFKNDKPVLFKIYKANPSNN